MYVGAVTHNQILHKNISMICYAVSWLIISFHVILFRFSQCTHQRMHHITQAEYDEFVSIVCSARNAFCMTAGGMVQFNELLQSLRRSKSCKKDLWQRIVNALATGNIWCWLLCRQLLYVMSIHYCGYDMFVPKETALQDTMYYPALTKREPLQGEPYTKQ